MRLFAGLLAALVLAIAPPAYAKCPPLKPKEVVALKQVEREEIAAAKTPSQMNGISIAPLTSFCKLKPKALICAGGIGTTLTLAQVRAVDAVFRAAFEYRSDDVQYGDDVWNDATVCGDCEDYALTIASRLHAAGEGGGSMALMVWSPATGGAHATLVVDTADAGLVEIGTGPASEGPHTFDPKNGRRFGFIVLDGRREIVPFPGYLVTSDHSAVISAR
jgi:predicted transglutaminase-like cysteine proteinase